jgi:ParB family chromosome partitioning protein
MAQPSHAADKIHEIKLSDIRVSKENVRRQQADKEELEDLANSIKKHGLLQPVMLRGRYEDGPPYELIVGQRCFRAHEKLRKPRIRAVFVEGLDDTHAMLLSLAENIHRVELTYADAADAVTALYKKFGRDERKVVAETGMSLRKVRQCIYIQERASEETKKKLRSREVSLMDAQRALLAADGDSKKADQLLRFMKQYELTSYQKKRMVEYGTAHPNAVPKKVVEEALEPKVEPNIIVNLPEDVRKALTEAAEKLNLSDEEVASRALKEWLSDKGFLSEQ